MGAIGEGGVRIIDDAVRRVRGADQVICLEQPVRFRAVGEFYRVFDQTTDAEVVRILNQAGAGHGREPA